MKHIRFVYGLIFVIGIVIIGLISVNSVFAAPHSPCDSCCGGSTRTCAETGGGWCTGSPCWDTPDCTPGDPTNLNVSVSGMQVTLSWTPGGNNSITSLRVDNTADGWDGSCTSAQGDFCLDTTETSYTFAADSADSYRWWIHGGNDCSVYSSPVYGRTITWPTNGNTTLASGETGSCTNNGVGGCNTLDMMNNLDPNYDRKVPFQVTFTDLDKPTGSNYTDIKNAYVIFSDGSTDYFRITYTDHGNSTWSLTKSGTKNVLIENAIVTAVLNSLGTSSRTKTANGSGYNLTLSFVLDFSGLGQTDSFLSNTYLQTLDFIGAQSATNLKVGSGSFTSGEALYPKGTHSQNALDIWNGKDVRVSAFLSRTGGVSLTGSMNVTFTPSGGCSYSAQTPALSEGGTTAIYLPYYNFGGAGNCAFTMQSTTKGYYVSGSTFTNFNGTDNTSTNGTATNSVRNGGVRLSGALNTGTVKYEDDAPSLPSGALTLGASPDASCSSASNGCNSKDLAKDIDTSRDRKIQVQVKVDDNQTNPLRDGVPSSANKKSDIKTIVWRLRKSDNTEVFRYTYTDSESGGNVTYDRFFDAATIADTSFVINPSVNVPPGSDTLTWTFTMDLAQIISAADFTGKVTVQTTDFAGATTGEQTLASSLDIWNGKDIVITGAFYEVNQPQDICAVNRGGVSTRVGSNFSAIYTPGGVGSSPITASDWSTGKAIQVFYYFGGGPTSVSYTFSGSPSFYLVGFDAQLYGGSCYYSGDGSGKISGGKTVTDVVYQDGGVSLTGSTYPNAAFGVKTISATWSTMRDGHFFVNSVISPEIEASTCTGSSCYLMGVASSGINGLLVVNNGSVPTSVPNNNYGSPKNWYADASSGTNPFVQTTLPTFAESSALFANSGFTVLSGNQTIAAGSFTPSVDTGYSITGNLTVNTGALVAANTTYIVNGNLTINDNIAIAANKYVYFIVSGNVTVASTVTGIDGIFMVSGNATIADNGVANYDPANTSEQFTLAGSLAVGGTLTISRTMGAANNVAPPVIFQLRPDMITQVQQVGLPIAEPQQKWQGEF